jgi:hypothetical protein
MSAPLQAGSVDELRKLWPMSLVATALLGGRTGGMFRWDATSAATDDGAIIIRPDGYLVGAWVRSFSGPADVVWFGAACDGVADDSEALYNATQAYAAVRISGPLRFAAGDTPSHIVFPNGISLYFDAPGAALVPDLTVTVTVTNVAILAADGQTIVGGAGTVTGWPR